MNSWKCQKTRKTKRKIPEEDFLTSEGKKCLGNEEATKKKDQSLLLCCRKVDAKKKTKKAKVERTAWPEKHSSGRKIH